MQLVLSPGAEASTLLRPRSLRSNDNGAFQFRYFTKNPGSSRENRGAEWAAPWKASWRRRSLHIFHVLLCEPVYFIFPKENKGNSGLLYIAVIPHVSKVCQHFNKSATGWRRSHFQNVTAESPRLKWQQAFHPHGACSRPANFSQAFHPGLPGRGDRALVKGAAWQTAQPGSSWPLGTMQSLFLACRLLTQTAFGGRKWRQERGTGASEDQGRRQRDGRGRRAPVS